jgi:very-short-patch-repair endonuclease
MAAVLACGPDAVLSHLAAARLWRLIPQTPAWPEVTRPEYFRRRPGIVSHRTLLPADERTSLDRIPVTTVPRTILDLASVFDRPRLERAINEVELRGLTDRLSIPDLLARHPRRRGTALLRAILGERAALIGVTANEFEAAFAEMIAAAGLTRPRFNADLAVRGRFLRPDVMWEREKVIVELDGRAAHGTSLAFERDRARDRLLLLDGWRIVRVTWLQLRDTPEAVAADLRELLAPSAASTLRA